jgi:hypothetical protein
MISGDVVGTNESIVIREAHARVRIFILDVGTS